MKRKQRQKFGTEAQLAQASTARRLSRVHFGELPKTRVVETKKKYDRRLGKNVNKNKEE